jgi:hypothetical protein
LKGNQQQAADAGKNGSGKYLKMCPVVVKYLIFSYKQNS